jgi:hypothetical protein
MKLLRSITTSLVVLVTFTGTTLLSDASAGAVTLAAPAATSVTAPLEVTRDRFANNEESLGMSPDGSLLAGSWNDWEFNDGCGFSYSADGGASWAPETFVPGLTQFTNDPDVPGTGRFEIAGDPAVAYNPKFGTFDVVCQAFNGSPPFEIQLMATAFDPAKANRDADVNFSYGTAVGGAPAWTTPAAVTSGHSNGTQKGSNGQFPDHESIAVDTGRGPGHHFGRLFVSWAEFNGSGRSPISLAYSDDNGRTWTGPIRVSDQGHQFDQDARPSIGPDGTVYVTWVNGPNETSLKNNLVMAAMSTDGGTTWSPSFTAAPIVAPIPGQLPNSRYRVFTDAWSTVDQASGRLVVGYTDQQSGAANIYAVHNLRPGDLSSWSAPVRVKASANQQFFPWLSSAPGGRVDLVFYDRACDPADTRNCVTLASTSDSGQTWGITPLTSRGFDGDRFQACLAFVEPPDCGSFFLGDYIAVASADSVAQVLWTGNGPHAMDVFSQRVSF